MRDAWIAYVTFPELTWVETGSMPANLNRNCGTNDLNKRNKKVYKPIAQYRHRCWICPSHETFKLIHN